MIPNELLQREDLSWGSKGLLSYILSLPPSWVLYKSKLIEASNMGKDAFERIWKELQSKGYIVGGKNQSVKNGKFGAKDFMVFDVPQEVEEETVAGNPHRDRCGKSDSTVAGFQGPTVAENPQLEILIDINTNNINTNAEVDKKSTSSSVYKKCIDLYDQFCREKLNAGCKIDGAQGKAMKQIIQYLLKNAPTGSSQEVIYTWTHILLSWDQLDKFYKSQMKLTQINSNLINIINQLKNGKYAKHNALLSQLEEIRQLGESDQAYGEPVASGSDTHSGSSSANDIHKGRGFD